MEPEELDWKRAVTLLLIILVAALLMVLVITRLAA
jgi:hypothetical protein